MARVSKKTKQVQRLSLSEHTLSIDLKRKKRDFNFSDVADYVDAIAGGPDSSQYRAYQRDAIERIMMYLWDGSYMSIEDLAKENFRKKEHIRARFGSEEYFLAHLPLRDRLSGVCHMATGTGKSYVMFAVAYLSIVMGYTKRVLVLGPPSTIIEEGLYKKFNEFLRKPEWNALLPKEYQGKAIALCNDNDAIEDNSIVIENINAIFTFGGIWDTLFNETDDLLVLSDEVHHAYSHLEFKEQTKKLELDEEVGGKLGDAKETITEAKSERLWLQFLLGKGRFNQPQFFRQDGTHKITRHIGFTGTPYNADDYFADVIYDYNIRVAIDQTFIKDVDPIKDVDTEDGDGSSGWGAQERYQIILEKHKKLSEKYAYRDSAGKRRVKPITVFYCKSVAIAKSKTEEFIQFMATYHEQNEHGEETRGQVEQRMREKVICVTTGVSESEYKHKLEHIEEVDPAKVGGQVEFIFSVSKLLEGWDVDNVFQIVPMEERVFDSKLLISQVIGRGLRIPRKVPPAQIAAQYPFLYVTNHEKFAKHIEELLNAIVQSDMFVISEPLEEKDDNDWRGKYHFSVFNLSQLAATTLEDVEPQQETLTARTLELSKVSATEKITITRLRSGAEGFALKKDRVSVDSIVDAIHRRFATREYEGIHFDFGQGEQHRCPTEDEIRRTITDAMEKAGIAHNELVEENKKSIELYFNQYLPKGKKKRVFHNIFGNILPTSTKHIERGSVKVGEFSNNASAFLSEAYLDEVDDKTKMVVDHLRQDRKPQAQATLGYADPTGLLGKHSAYVQSLVVNDDRPPFLVHKDRMKTPQSTTLVTHSPEKEFVFRLLENAEYVDGWVKSPDKGFYSIDYEYWKGGKDRVRRGFNPDFFIRIDLERYIATLIKAGVADHLAALRALQDQGIEELIRVVEIKSDEDDDEATPAKADWAIKHFDSLNKKLREVNPVDVPEEHRTFLKQHYTFDLLKPEGYHRWFEDLCKGEIV